MRRIRDLKDRIEPPAAMADAMRRVVLCALSIMVIACGNTVPVDQSPAGSPPRAHATGATDVILRLDEGGGATTPTFLAVQPPTFTLYGDGTVLFRNGSGDPTPARPAARFAPFRIAKLSEAQIQALLTSALGEGGLGSARRDYPDARIAPVPTAIFTINASGIEKTVAVVGLDVAVADGPDVLARRAFAGLAQRLRGFDGDESVPSDAYSPARYRGFLSIDSSADSAGQAPKAWPWADLAPADFITGAEPDTTTHTLTDSQVRLLGIPGYQGGFIGLGLVGPGDAMTYALQLRPLLPDEAN